MQVPDYELAQYLLEISGAAPQNRGVAQQNIKSPKPKKPVRLAQAENKPLSPAQKQELNAQIPDILQATGMDVSPLGDQSVRPLKTGGLVSEQDLNVENAQLKERSAAMQQHIERLNKELREARERCTADKLNEALTECTRLREELAGCQIQAKKSSKDAEEAQQKIHQLERYYSTDVGNTRKERSLVQMVEQLRQENKKLKVQVYQGIKEREMLKRQLGEFQRGIRSSGGAK